MLSVKEIQFRKSLVTHTQLSQVQIAKQLGMSKQSVAQFCAKHFEAEVLKSRFPVGQGQRGKSWAVGHLNTKGHRMVEKPSWWTGAPKSRTVAEHHLVYGEAHNITAVPAGHQIHHINHEKLDNRVTNLELLTTSQHIQVHRGIERLTSLYVEVR